MNKLENLLSLANLLRLGAIIQLSVLSASALVPRVLDWRKALAPLHPFIRSLFWVYGWFIVMVIVSFAALTFLNARPMAAGEPVARSLAGFIAVFWAARLAVQIFVFDCRDFLRTRLLALGYRCLTLAFIYLTAVYGWTALGNWRPI